MNMVKTQLCLVLLMSVVLSGCIRDKLDLVADYGAKKVVKVYERTRCDLSPIAKAYLRDAIYRASDRGLIMASACKGDPNWKEFFEKYIDGPSRAVQGLGDAEIAGYVVKQIDKIKEKTNVQSKASQ